MNNKPTYEELEQRIKELEKKSAEHKQTGAAARRNEEFLNYAIDSLTHPFLVIDAEDYSIVMANAAARQYSSDSETTCYALSHNRDAPCEEQMHPCPLAEVKRTGKPTRVEHIHFHKDGSPRTVAVHAFPVFDENRRVEQIIHYSFDVTEQKLAEEALKKSEERLEAIMDNSPAVIYVKDTQGRYVMINRQYETLFSVTREEIIGESNHAIHTEANADVFPANDQKVIETGVPLQQEVLATQEDGVHAYISVNFPLIDSSGRIYAVCSISTDITERKRAEEILKKNELELENQTRKLEEANTALKVLLEHEERKKTEVEEKILSNVTELIIPFVERLKTGRLDAHQNNCLRIIESNLEDIISPLAHRLSSKFAGLTPTEIQVSDLIRGGKTNKEITELLCVSKETVKFHRGNIRKKLGLKNNKQNLKSYLLTLS